MSLPPVVLIHGAATTAAVWDRLVPRLTGLSVRVPDRPCSGDLEREIAFLRPLAEGAVVVGVGGGATLGLALLAGGVRVAGGLLHEPAAGSLAPGLLDGVARAYAQDGVAGFALALYGPSWEPGMAPRDEDAVRRDLTMFRAFEPAGPTAPADHVVTTAGKLSDPVRHEVGQALRDRFGLGYRTLPGCRHAVHLDAPAALAAQVWAVVRECQQG